jgi:hypothetical protein
VLAWGRGDHGALGNGSTRDSRALVRVKLPAGARVTSLFAGMSHGLALTKAGRILAWGSNGTGQLGNGGTADRHVPVRVHLPAGVRVTAITAGQDYSMALTADGGLLAWGGNSRGQLGTGTRISTVVPVRLVLPPHRVAAIIGAGPVSRTSLAVLNPHLTP